ncbi:unnamed protein product [Didymodactylos carnosus]|uniref:Sphingomyelin synthase-like domain-containing protein n=1 Tax=Didymodactylos carnosus TaxID=1234261 RepID=A0A814N3G2_9BILA|nr:unnamed protein product [Didymodactylos carnosus]CAF1101599.1 unnamed protein product [Didymodactylos carnosus]CAF3850636.1 unnamed protein product [Didymodactylos carnosus]CAF3862923.1 unnamed protein product [Didymodactylos carnosus]
MSIDIHKYLPLILSFVFFFVALYVNSLVQVIADRQSPNELPPLPDIGHKILPYWSYFQVNNYLLFTIFISVIIRYIFQSNIRLIVFRRWLFIQGLMFCMRSFSIYITALSVPQPGCNTTAVGSPEIEAFYIMLTIHATCGDVMFSGHTVTITICALCWTNYSKGEEYTPFIWLYRKCFNRHYIPTIEQSDNHLNKNRFLQWLFYPKLDATGDPLTLYFTSYLIWLYSISSYLFIIATRFHYSVDVFIGFLLTYFTWKSYHFYIKTLFERRKIIISRFFIWFEGLQQDTSVVLPQNNQQQAGVPVSLLTGNDYHEQGQYYPVQLNNNNTTSVDIVKPGDGQHNEFTI